MASIILTGLFSDLGDGGHEKKLFKKRFRFDVRKFVFSNMVVLNWNSLSTQCVNSCTISTFKKRFQVSWSQNPVMIDN